MNKIEAFHTPGARSTRRWVWTDSNIRMGGMEHNWNKTGRRAAGGAAGRLATDVDCDLQ